MSSRALYNMPLRLSVTMLDTYVHGMANEDMSSEQLAHARQHHSYPERRSQSRSGAALHAAITTMKVRSFMGADGVLCGCTPD